MMFGIYKTKLYVHKNMYGRYDQTQEQVNVFLNLCHLAQLKNRTEG